MIEQSWVPRGGAAEMARECSQGRPCSWALMGKQRFTRLSGVGKGCQVEQGVRAQRAPGCSQAHDKRVLRLDFIISEGEKPEGRQESGLVLERALPALGRGLSYWEDRLGQRPDRPIGTERVLFWAGSEVPQEGPQVWSSDNDITEKCF